MFVCLLFVEPGKCYWLPLQRKREQIGLDLTWIPLNCDSDQYHHLAVKNIKDLDFSIHLSCLGAVQCSLSDYRVLASDRLQEWCVFLCFIITEDVPEVMTRSFRNFSCQYGLAKVSSDYILE